MEARSSEVHLQDQLEELANEDSAEANGDNEYTLTEERHSEEAGAAFSIKVTHRQCKRWKICAYKSCPVRRLCGKRKGYCDIFVGCICNRRICKKKYNRFCKHLPCKRLLRCIRLSCPRCHGRYCHYVKKLCNCKKELCKWKFKVTCPRYPRLQSEIEQMDEPMAQIEKFCNANFDANFDANVESEMINDAELEGDEE